MRLDGPEYYGSSHSDLQTFRRLFTRYSQPIGKAGPARGSGIHRSIGTTTRQKADEEAGKWIATTGSIIGPEGTLLEVSDTWRPVDETTVQVDLEVRLSTAGKSPSVRIDFSLETAVSGASGLDMSYLEID